MRMTSLWKYGDWRHVAMGCTAVVFIICTQRINSRPTSPYLHARPFLVTRIIVREGFTPSNILRQPDTSDIISILTICTNTAMDHVFLCYYVYSRCGHLYLCPVVSSFCLLFFPRLISAVSDWMSTIFPHMMWHVP